MDRILEEIEWFGKNHIDYLENADANFALLARDVQIAEALAKAKEKYGTPTRFRAAFAKYSNKRISDQIFETARILKKSGQLKAVTMALQSTNESVLENIDRKNISMSGFKDLMEQYRKDDIPTYVEVIIGLPGEMYASFKDGLDQILSAGGHQGIAIYMCMMLPNSEMSNPEYVEKYGLKSVPMRAMLIHGVPNHDAPDEIQETVIETNTMSHEEWKHAYMLSWIIQCLHTTGLTQWWAIKEKEGGLKYSSFYEALLSFASKRLDTVLGKVWNHTWNLLQNAVTGGSWDNVLPGFGEVSWPPDEGGFLMIVKELDKFYQEMEDLQLMPKEQREHGPPPIPPGQEEGYARCFWYNRKADLNKYLQEFCKGVKNE